MIKADSVACVPLNLAPGRIRGLAVWPGGAPWFVALGVADVHAQQSPRLTFESHL